MAAGHSPTTLFLLRFHSVSPPPLLTSQQCVYGRYLSLPLPVRRTLGTLAPHSTVRCCIKKNICWDYLAFKKKRWDHVEYSEELGGAARSSVTVVTGLPPTHLPALNFEGEECELLSSQTHPSQSRLPLPEPSPDTHLVAANNTDGN